MQTFAAFNPNLFKIVKIHGVYKANQNTVLQQVSKIKKKMQCKLNLVPQNCDNSFKIVEISNTPSKASILV